MAASGAAQTRGRDRARGPARSRVAPLFAVVALTLMTLSFHALGSGGLAPPPWSPLGWPAWIGARDPLLATAAILRLIVLLLCWYLLVAIVLGGLARVLRAARLVRFADAVTVPFVRRLVQGAFGLTVATAVATSVPGGAAHAGSRPASSATSSTDVASVALATSVDPAVALPVLGPGRSSSRTVTHPVSGHHRASSPAQAVDHPLLRPRPDDGRLLLRGIDDPGELGSGAHTDVTGGTQPRSDDRRGDAPGVAHEVVPGDSFWSIAADRVRAVAARPPTDAEITAYWRRLIAANVDRLAVPEDPDLIFPGQRFRLPEVAVDRATDGGRGTS